jgi:hypothetical protein
MLMTGISADWPTVTLEELVQPFTGLLMVNE